MNNDTNTAPQEAQQEQVQALWSDQNIEDWANRRFGADVYFEVVEAMTDMRQSYEADRLDRRAREDELRARVAELEGQLAEARKWVPSHTYQSGGVTFPLSQAMVQDAIEDTVWDETLSDDTEANDGQ